MTVLESSMIEVQDGLSVVQEEIMDIESGLSVVIEDIQDIEDDQFVQDQDILAVNQAIQDAENNINDLEDETESM